MNALEGRKGLLLLPLCLAAGSACVEGDRVTDGGHDAGHDAGQDGGTGDAGGDSQATYEYPGCANQDYGCPRLLTVYCAIEAIQAKYSACVEDTDCADSAFNGQCTGIGSCPPPLTVAGSEVDAFLAEANVEVNRYCVNAGCRSGGSCGVGGWTLRCLDGGCVAVPDSGT